MQQISACVFVLCLTAVQNLENKRLSYPFYVREFGRFEPNSQGDLELFSSKANVIKNRNGTPERKNQFATYVIRDSWPKTDLSYKILTYPETLSQHEVDDCIARAFQAWSKHSQLNFEQSATNSSDIEIRFSKSGPNGTEFSRINGFYDSYAFAFFPKGGGNIYISESEPWTCGDGTGISLFHVALHEIGHALGLDHAFATNGDSVMYPVYKTEFTDLRRDDIAGIQRLYGRRTTTAAPPTTTASTTTTTASTTTTTTASTTTSAARTSYFNHFPFIPHVGRTGPLFFTIPTTPRYVSRFAPSNNARQQHENYIKIAREKFEASINDYQKKLDEQLAINRNKDQMFHDSFLSNNPPYYDY